MIQLLAWVLACIIGSLLGSLASVAHGGYEVAGHPVAVTWFTAASERGLTTLSARAKHDR